MKNDYKNNYKKKLVVCGVIFILCVISFIINMIRFNETDYAQPVYIIHSFAFSVIVTVSVIMAAKSSGNRRIVFEPEKYRYNPEDKEKLSLDEIIYYMRDTFIVKLFYGIALFLWGVIFIITNVMLVTFEGATVKDAIRMNIGIFVGLAIINGVFFMILHLMKKSEYKQLLIKNTEKYVTVSKESFCNVLQQDLYKGIRFRSRGIMLTGNFILGSLNKIGLSPIAIPVELVNDIRYSISFYGWPTGKRYMELKFYINLLDGNSVILYVNYVNWEIVVQMFKYYGFNIQSYNK